MHTLFSLRLIFTSQINHDIIASHCPPLLQENRHGCFNTLKRLWASDNQWCECQTSWHLTCLTWSAVLKHLKKASGTTAEKVNTPVTAVNQQCLTCQRMTDGHLFLNFFKWGLELIYFQQLYHCEISITHRKKAWICGNNLWLYKEERLHW